MLGTSSQVPTRHRNHNGYLLLWDGVGILFDPGEGTQRQLIHCGVKASMIHAICVTHFHGDHCLGLPGIVQRISLDGIDRELPIAFPESGNEFFERLRHASIFDDRTRSQAMPLSRKRSSFRLGDLEVHAAPLEHTVECWGYRVQEPDRWRLLPERLEQMRIVGPERGKLAREGRIVKNGKTIHIEEVAQRLAGQSMAFVMDSRPCENAVTLAQNVDLLVCESTYLQADGAEAHTRGHMTATDAAEIALQANARRLVLTHFSQRYPSVEPFVVEASAIHPDVHVAHDGLVVDCPPRP